MRDLGSIYGRGPEKFAGRDPEAMVFAPASAWVYITV
jgi:hypothetical protein